MKRRNNWLTNAMFSKLSDISQVVKETFGDNNDGRGHWEEIELMRRLFSYGDVTDKGFSPKLPTLNMRRENSDYEISTYPTFVLQYVCEKNKSRIIKLFSCGDDGIFSNDRLCVLLLKDKHFYNVWKYECLILNMDNPTIRGKSGGASAQSYKKLFCLRCMVSYSTIIYMCVKGDVLGVRLRPMSILMREMMKMKLFVVIVEERFYKFLVIKSTRVVN